MPGAQQAALTNPAIPKGIAMVTADVAKLVDGSEDSPDHHPQAQAVCLGKPPMD